MQCGISHVIRTGRIPVQITCDLCAVQLEPYILYGSIRTAPETCRTLFWSAQESDRRVDLHPCDPILCIAPRFADRFRGVVNLTYTPAAVRMNGVRF
ncbi:unnamed protein product [Staurois parvus]|uniref:Uncharacterized protein n=1 Tax=Staurois parvus TaxID=386267 RepID=A0ABN9BZA5_9NEOB|nr:unnamed protein product [Staurois parvus]